MHGSPQSGPFDKHLGLCLRRRGTKCNESNKSYITTVMVHNYFLCGGAGPSQRLQLNDGIQPTEFFSVPELKHSVNNISAFQQKGNNKLLLHLSI